MVLWGGSSEPLVFDLEQVILYFGPPGAFCAQILGLLSGLMAILVDATASRCNCNGSAMNANLCYDENFLDHEVCYTIRLSDAQIHCNLILDTSSIP